MYKCGRCKTDFQGEPAMRNNAGSFCFNCEVDRKRKMAVAAEHRSNLLGDSCLWCGDKAARQSRGKEKQSIHVCQRCDEGRDWLLRCIRHSNRPSDYVLRTESREAPLRIEREKLAAIERQANATAGADKAKQTPDAKDETRLDRLERLLEKLTESLGGV